MKEVYPVVDVHPVGLLVADVADDHGLSFLAKLQDGAQCVLHGYANGTHALAQTKKQAVEVFVLYWVVNLTALRLGRHPER
jgi:hypothetical protein